MSIQASELKLDAQERQSIGKNEARRLRRQGLVPGNLMEGGKASSLSFSAREFQQLVQNGLRESTILNLSVQGGASAHVIVKEVQRDPVTADFLHVDFLKVREGHRVLVRIPIEWHGLARGVKGGGTLEHHLRSIRVRATPESLIDVIRVDVTNLDAGEFLKLSQLGLPDSWEILLQGDPVVVKVAPGRMSVQEAAVQAGEEPAKKKK